MKSYFELSESIISLSNHQKTKINIHLKVEEPLFSECLKANSHIDAISDNDITFDDCSICIPHISLAMGYIYSIDDLRNVFIKLSKHVEHLSSFEYKPESIILKSVSVRAPKYVFINSMQDPYISELRDELYSVLEGIIQPLEWDYRSEAPHITLARCKDPDSKLNQYLKELSPNLPSFRVKNIGVSFAGTRGVCLGNLKTFSLLDKAD